MVLSAGLSSDRGKAGKSTLHCQSLCLPKIEVVACLIKIAHCEAEAARHPALEYAAAAEALEIKARGR